MSARRVWTEDEVFALGTRCTVEQASSILGLGGKQKAYDLLEAGEFLVPWYEVNGRKWVPTRPIRELLRIEPNPNPNSAEGAGPIAPSAEPSQEVNEDGKDQSTRRFRAI